MLIDQAFKEQCYTSGFHFPFLGLSDTIILSHCGFLDTCTSLSKPLFLAQGLDYIPSRGVDLIQATWTLSSFSLGVNCT